MRAALVSVALSASLLACQRAHEDAPPVPPTPVEPGVAPRPVVRTQTPPAAPIVPAAPDDKRMYTTYFYTAGEAVIHGYAADTTARIVSIADPGTDRKAGTIWEGKLGVGEVKMVPTGNGVFGLLTDKKAAILVGTPSSCAVVGYFVKDDEGRFLANHFFTQLPSAAQIGSERVVVWAYDAADVTIRVPGSQKVVATKSLAAGGRLELDHAALVKLGPQVLDISSTSAPVSVEVYYDQGFIVPSREGRGVGTDFSTFVGAITTGTNDLDVVAIDHDAVVHVTDVDTHKELWTGTVKAGAIHTTSLTNRYVRVTSDQPVEVMVAAFEHDGPGYAEQHFATGREGGGIDTDFELTTSGSIWLFSYFADNKITITDAATGKSVYEGALSAGTGHEVTARNGLYRVHSSKGISAMGGASTCGADYSPAAGMFAVDDEMMSVLAQVQQARVQDALTTGVAVSPAAAAAPISPAEWEHYGAKARAKGYTKMSATEANERIDEISKKK